MNTRIIRSTSKSKIVELIIVDLRNDYSCNQRHFREFVINQLGETFVQQENLDVGKAYAETSAATPLIFILGEEVDPCKYIFR